MNNELELLKLEKTRLIEDNQTTVVASIKYGEEQKEAMAAFGQLDETRLMLNKLLGPNGSIAISDKNRSNKGNQEVEQSLDQGKGPSAPAQKVNQDYHVKATADELNDEDFWYQTPNGGNA